MPFKIFLPFYTENENHLTTKFNNKPTLPLKRLPSNIEKIPHLDCSINKSRCRYDGPYAHKSIIIIKHL